LYSRVRSQALADFQLPELRRSPLDEMCLQAKLIEVPGAPRTPVAAFLAKAVEPPLAQAVTAAVQVGQGSGSGWGSQPGQRAWGPICC
jgi:HrpA-like RNA helicase